MRGKQARIIAWLLSVVLLSGTLSMPAYAGDAGTAPETTQTQTEENRAAESESDSKDKDKSAESGSGDQKSSDSSDSGETKKEESDAKEPSKEDSGSSGSGSSGSASDAGSDGNSSDSGNQNDSSSESKQAETPDDTAGSGTDGKAAPADQSEGNGSDTGSNAGSDADANASTNPASSDDQSAAPAAADGKSTLSVPVTDLLDAAQDPALLNESKAAGDAHTVSGTLSEGDQTKSINNNEETFFSFTPSASGKYEFLAYCKVGSSYWGADTISLYDADWKELESDYEPGSRSRYICQDLTADQKYYLGIYDPDQTSARIFVCKYKEPTITQPPEDKLNKAYGENVSFSVKADGSDLNFEWEESRDNKNWNYYYEESKLPGDGVSTINVTAEGSRFYRCTISDRRGNRVVTDTVKLTLAENAAAETVETITGTGSYRTVVDGKTKLVYDFEPEDAGTYVISCSYNTSDNSSRNLELVDSGWSHIGFITTEKAQTIKAAAGSKYHIVIKNSESDQIIVGFNIVETAPLTISTQPASQEVAAGARAHLSVEAEGENLSYEWQYRYCSQNENLDDLDEDSWTNYAYGSQSDIDSQPVYEDVQFRCVIRDARGTEAVSDIATVSVKSEAGDSAVELAIGDNKIDQETIYCFTPDADGKYDFNIPNYNVFYLYGEDGKLVDRQTGDEWFTEDLHKNVTYTVCVNQFYNEDGTGTISIYEHIPLRITGTTLADQTVKYGEEVSFSVNYEGIASSIYAIAYTDTEDGEYDDWNYVENEHNGSATWTTTVTESMDLEFRLDDMEDNPVTSKRVQLSVDYEDGAEELKLGANTVSPGKAYKFTTGTDGAGDYGLYATAFAEDTVMYSRLIDGDFQTIKSGDTDQNGALILADSLQAGKTYYFVFSGEGNESGLQVELRKEPALSIKDQPPASMSVRLGEKATLPITVDGVVGQYTWKCSTDGGTTWNYTADSGSGECSELAFYPIKSMKVRCEIRDCADTTTLISNTVDLTVTGNIDDIPDTLKQGQNAVSASAGDISLYKFTAKEGGDYTFTGKAGDGTAAFSIFSERNDHELDPIATTKSVSGDVTVLSEYYIGKGSSVILAVQSERGIADIPFTISGEGDTSNLPAFRVQPKTTQVALGEDAVFTAEVEDSPQFEERYAWEAFNTYWNDWENLENRDNVNIDKTEDGGSRLTIPSVDHGELIRCRVDLYTDGEDYNSSRIYSDIVSLDVTETDTIRKLNVDDNSIETSAGNLFSFTPPENGNWFFDGNGWLKEGSVYDSKWDLVDYGGSSFAAYLYKDRTYYVKLVPEESFEEDTNTLTITMLTPMTIKEQPNDLSVDAGQSVSFNIVAEGSGLTYELQEKTANGWSPVTENDTGEFTRENIYENQTLRIRIFDAAGNEKNSNEFTITVEESSITDIVLDHNYTVTEGAQAYRFTPTETGAYKISGTLTVTSEASVSGEIRVKDDTTMWFDASDNQPGTDEHLYYMKGGKAYYLTAEIFDEGATGSLSFKVIENPMDEFRIISSPQDQEVPLGATITVQVEANGTGLQYELYEGTDEDNRNSRSSSPDGTFVLNCASTQTYWVYVYDIAGAYGWTEPFTITVKDEENVEDLTLNTDHTFSAKARKVYRFTPETDMLGKLTASMSTSSEDPQSEASSTIKVFSSQTEVLSDEIKPDQDCNRFDNYQAGETYYLVVAPSDDSSYQDSDMITLRLDQIEEKELKITKQPKDQSIKAGDSLELSVEAEGTELSYEWVVGEDHHWGSDTFTLERVFEDTDAYCIIRDVKRGSLESDHVHITVDSTDVTPITLGQKYTLDSSKPVYSFTPDQPGQEYEILHSFGTEKLSDSCGIGYKIYFSAATYSTEGYVSYTPKENSLTARKTITFGDNGTYYIVFEPNHFEVSGADYSFILRENTSGEGLRILSQPDETYYVKEGKTVYITADLNQPEFVKVDWYSTDGTQPGENDELIISDSRTLNVKYSDADQSLRYYYKATQMPPGEEGDTVSTGTVVTSGMFRIIPLNQAYVDTIGGTKDMSLFLTDKIGMRIHMGAQADKLRDRDFMRFRYNGKVVEQRVSEAHWDDITVDGTPKHVLTFEIPLATKQMTDEVTFCMVVDGVEGTPTTTSVREYAKEVLEKSDTTESVKNMIKAMLNYGGYTQVYDQYKSDTPANVNIYGPDEDPVQKDEAIDLSKYERTVDIGNSPEGLHLKSVSLYLATDVSIRFYYTLDEGKEEADYTFSIDSADESMDKEPVFGVNGNKKYVAITHISPVELGNMYTLNVTSANGDEGTASVKYGPLSYCQRALANDSANKKIKDLCRSIYYYYQAAINMQ